MAEPEQGFEVLLVLAQSTGGIGQHARTLAAGLPRHGIVVTVCGPPATLAGNGLEVTGARLLTAPVGSGRPAAALSARRTLRQAAAGAGVVHAHGIRAGAAVAAAIRDVPLVVTWHNAALGGRRWRVEHALLSRYVARASDLTLAASEDLAAAARAAGAARVRTTFVAAPTLPPPVRPRGAVRAELGVGERPVVLAVGRLQRQKRLDVLVDAAAAWADRGNPPCVLVVGDGPEQERLAARIRASRAPVRLLGARGDVADLLAAADVVALPSEWEARSLVAQEAMRAGVPLVTTPVGGLPALVGDAAVLVPAGEPAALRDAIESLLADPDRRAELAAAGRRRAQSWPDEQAGVDELAATYLDLIHSRRRR